MERNDCSLLRSNSSRKPMASRKKAVVRLRNLAPGRVRQGELQTGGGVPGGSYTGLVLAG